MEKKLRIMKLRTINEIIDCLDEEPSKTNRAFNLLLDVYEGMEINWKDGYKNITLGGKLSGKRNRYIRKRIINNPPESLQDIKEKEDVNEDIDTEIINLARIIQLANKTAHSYMLVARKKLEQSGIYLGVSKLKGIYSPITEKGRRWALANIDEETKKKITEMSESGEDEIIKKLAMGNVKLFEIKNIALDKLLERLQELENPQERYSYGYKRDSRREVRNKDLFVFDIPGYGQFSVHIANKRIIKSLPSYKYPIYEKKNVLFFKGLNQQAREFLELDEPETTKKSVVKTLKESELGDSISHHLAVGLMGKENENGIRLTTSDLDDIEESFKNRREINRYSRY